MKLKKLLFFLITFGITTVIYSQINTNQNRVYSDYIADNQGNRLSGITVRVRGTNHITKTDHNGEFTITAKKGDVIILSKDGKRINTYTYNGSSQYRLNNNAEQDEAPAIYNSPIPSNSSISRSKLKRKLDTYQIAIDSAIFYSNNNANKSIFFVEKALKSTTNKKKTAKAYKILATNYVKLKQYDLAKSNYNAALTFLKSDIDLQLKYAHVLRLTKNYQESEDICINLLKTNNLYSSQKITIYENLALIYKSKKQYKNAILNFKKALKIAEKHIVAPKITSINSEIAAILSLQGNLQQSKTYYENAIASAKNIDEKETIVQSNKTANFYSKNNDYNHEIKLRKSNLKKLEDANLEAVIIDEEDKVTKQKIKYDIGNAYAKQKNYNEAINYFEESAKDAKSFKDIETEKSAIEGLTNVYVALGNDSKALFNYKKLHALTDLIYKQKEEKIKEVSKITKDLLNKQTRITSLELDRKLNESKLKLYGSEQQLKDENNKRQRLIIYSLLGGLILLLLSLFYMLRANKQRKLANNLLSLKSLRSQMNPHFIFNALNSVNGFIANNDERTANRYLTDFSTLMRSVLENSEQDFIPLEKEIELLELYLKLEHARFKDKFDYELNIDKNIKINEFLIPPMLLQPYVENAVWHGLRYKNEKGKLKINIKQLNSETLTINIIDNGIGRKKSKSLKSKNQLQHKSKGMQNIKQRIKILNEMYKDKVDVYIDDLNQDNTGTKVSMTLKKD